MRRHCDVNILQAQVQEWQASKVFTQIFALHSQEELITYR